MAEDKIAKIRRLEKIARIQELEAQSQIPSQEEQARVKEAQAYDRPLEAAGKSAANVGLLGYLPEVEALASRAGSKLADLYYGNKEEDLKKFNLQAPSYEQELSGAREEQKKLEEFNPKASTVGTVGGALIQAPLMSAGLAKAGIGAGGGLLARVGKSAGIGAGMGAVQNPGELQEGEDQINARLRQAVTGGLLGAGGEALGSAVGKGVEAVKSLGAKSKSAAGALAVHAAGGAKKDFTRKDIIELGETAIRDGIVDFGDDVTEIAAKSKKTQQEVGKKIGDIYEKIGFMPQNPTELGNKLSNAVATELPKTEYGALAEKAKTIIDDVLSNPDIIRGDVRAMNDLVGEWSERINWSKAQSQLGGELPETQQMYRALRDTLRKELNDIAEQTGHKQLRELNKQYSAATTINKMSTAKDAAEKANALFGLRDTGIGTGAGLLYGGAQIAQGDVDAEDALKTLATGVGAGLVARGARRYGTPALMKGLLKTGDLAESAVANARGLLPDQVRSAIKQGLIDPRSQVLNAMQVNRKDK